MRTATTRVLAVLFLGLVSVVVVVLVAFAVMTAVWHVRAPAKHAYVSKNDEIVQRLPRPAGAREIARKGSATEDWWGEQLCHTVGYTTDATYAIPATLEQRDLIRTFRQRLRRWHQQTWTVDGVAEACFDPHGATVTVDTSGMTPSLGATHKTFGIVVDHDGGRCD